MKLEVTKQDKVLLSFLLAVFAAAACIFLGIIPLHRGGWTTFISSTEKLPKATAPRRQTRPFSWKR